MQPINKLDLKGKYVSYTDKDWKFRTHKVVRITGNTLTVKDILGKRTRVHKDKIIGRQLKKKVQSIEWKLKK
jgi:hypothetical protein